MDMKGPLLWLQESSTNPYLEPAESSSHQSLLLLCKMYTVC
jgi:hypothetical protein